MNYSELSTIGKLEQDLIYANLSLEWEKKFGGRYLVEITNLIQDIEKKIRKEKLKNINEC